MSAPAPNEREVWDRHWRKLSGESSGFGMLASWVRRWVLAPAVRHYAERYFADHGVFVELGCGTGQASGLIPRRRRCRVALDLSLPALAVARRAPHYESPLAGDLHSLPFADSAVAGVWNLGVMEHFDPETTHSVLLEIRRILRPGGVALFFWPPEFGLSRKALAPFEWWRSRRLGARFEFFPAEINRLRSRAHGRAILRDAGFETLAADFTARDGFVHVVMVGRKPA